MLNACSSLPTNSDLRRFPVRQETTVRLGGSEQAILIRGDDANNPVLLFLHGGPGVPEWPVYQLNTGLERDFTVVQWDQRGAGKSFDQDLDWSTLTVSRMVDDTLELTRILRQRFGGRKIHLVGFSFGSLIGTLAVDREPEHFLAYIGLSQFVNVPESEHVLDREARQRAREKGDAEILRRLEAIGPYPYATPEIEREVNDMQGKLVADATANAFTPRDYIREILFSRFYSLGDVVKLVRGHRRCQRALEKELHSLDLRPKTLRLEVPVWFFAGRQDTTLSQTVAKAYFDVLEAPMGKHFVWFDQARHALHLEDPNGFQEALRALREATGKNIEHSGATRAR